MVAAPPIDVINTALAPVQVLRGEQSELEASLRESFAELEALHDELADWQRDLTRQQAELDQRAAAIADAECGGGAHSGDIADMQQLAQAQEYSQQLDEENAERLQTLEYLERQLVAAQTELHTVRKHAEELSSVLAKERERAIDEHRLWSGELRDMRRLLERQNAALESLGVDAPVDVAGADSVDDGETSQAPDEQEEEPESDGETDTRSAELRRRAQSRRSRRRSN